MKLCFDLIHGTVGSLLGIAFFMWDFRRCRKNLKLISRANETGTEPESNDNEVLSLFLNNVCPTYLVLRWSAFG